MINAAELQLILDGIKRLNTAVFLRGEWVPMHYLRDEDGIKYVRVDVSLPEGVLAEVDGGTYGKLHGLRIDAENFAICEK